jgi:hypothetical protein
MIIEFPNKQLRNHGTLAFKQETALMFAPSRLGNAHPEPHPNGGDLDMSPESCARRVLALLAAIVWLLPTSAGAQEPAQATVAAPSYDDTVIASLRCRGEPGLRAAFAINLAAKFGEARRGAMLLPDGRVLEVWSNPETGTWTMLLTTARGLSCVAQAGRYPPSEAV